MEVVEVGMGVGRGRDGSQDTEEREAIEGDVSEGKKGARSRDGEGERSGWESEGGRRWDPSRDRGGGQERRKGERERRWREMSRERLGWKSGMEGEVSEGRKTGRGRDGKGERSGWESGGERSGWTDRVGRRRWMGRGRGRDGSRDRQGGRKGGRCRDGEGESGGGRGRGEGSREGDVGIGGGIEEEGRKEGKAEEVGMEVGIMERERRKGHSGQRREKGSSAKKEEGGKVRMGIGIEKGEGEIGEVGGDGWEGGEVGMEVGKDKGEGGIGEVGDGRGGGRNHARIEEGGGKEGEPREMRWGLGYGRGRGDGRERGRDGSRDTGGFVLFCFVFCRVASDGEEEERREIYGERVRDRGEAIEGTATTAEKRGEGNLSSLLTVSALLAAAPPFSPRAGNLSSLLTVSALLAAAPPFSPRLLPSRRGRSRGGSTCLY
ncbi:hypothetical protein CBR_g32520 [Chara braunii]|uniref:Uncharacterized protein n=1 Tax=Chara braunii TaxID=69332 RepID=A0A388LH46_CHABU|nr:hypothetical protein CBR_g32520 [Chara braunii]|eukprot:GBG81532.1 hypothetical protein CBR_g32520 [Chara braunii]